MAPALSLAGCDIPRDPANTQERVVASKVLRLGWVEGAKSDPLARRALDRLQRQTGARIEPHTGESERLLDDLRIGKLDLVYGHFPRASPWSKEVYFGQPLGWAAPPPKDEHVPRFLMRRGENGWIMTVEKASDRKGGGA